MIQVPVSEADTLLASYRFDLPPEQIAQQPGERGASRLLVVDRLPERQGSSPEAGQASDHCHAHFFDLADYLPEGALLVANNSRVIPARLTGTRQPKFSLAGHGLAGGQQLGKLEFLLLTPLPLLVSAAELISSAAGGSGSGSDGGYTVEAEGLIKPAKRIRPGDELFFGAEEKGAGLRLLVLEKGDFGRHKVRLFWGGRQEGEKASAASLRDCFEKNGHLPLPPYIRRPDTAEDARRYQTIYARDDKAGSVAAPTAGLHFTPELRAVLARRGIEWAEVTLHVGYGTFSPVRCADVREHVMHPEYVEVPEATAQAVNKAKAEGRPVLAVGTTSARTLEGVAQFLAENELGGKKEVLAAHAGWVNMFIRPGYSFRVIDGLITNFHLPESTLLMLVSALTGRERMLSLYAEAVRKGYRFFSYGDAMLIR